jgi:hypothetical protein
MLPFIAYMDLWVIEVTPARWRFISWKIPSIINIVNGYKWMRTGGSPMT